MATSNETTKVTRLASNGTRNLELGSRPRAALVRFIVGRGKRKDSDETLGWR